MTLPSSGEKVRGRLRHLNLVALSKAFEVNEQRRNSELSRSLDAGMQTQNTEQHTTNLTSPYGRLY
jgi:hypothetical protein